MPVHLDHRWSLPLRFVLARPRLFASACLGFLLSLLLPTDWLQEPVTRALMGWNAAALAYLLLVGLMMFSSSHERMRSRAMQEYEGSLLMLILVVCAALACVVAIVEELAVAKNLQAKEHSFHLVLVGLTIATSWAFTQTTFALHYAHDYYASAVHGAHGVHGGLDFPGNQAPDYGDFLYFAVIIGTSAQTADVALSSRKMRRTGTLHCVLAFFFNTTLLALTINIASGLF